MYTNIDKRYIRFYAQIITAKDGMEVCFYYETKLSIEGYNNIGTASDIFFY